MADIIQEPPRGSIGDMRAFQQTGLETLRRYVRGELPALPIGRLFGLQPTEAGPGKVAFRMPVTRWLEDGAGVYWGGVSALVADAALGCAIWTTLPAGKSVATSELSLSFVRPMSRQTTSIVARAESVHSGSQVGLSTAQILDPDGRLLAFGSTRCLIADVPVDPNRQYPAPDTGPADPPDPYLRHAPEADCYWSREQLERETPLRLQQGTLASGFAFPCWRLTGYRPTLVEPGRVTGMMPTSAWFSNGGPSVYGGLLAWAAEFTMGASVYSMLGAGDGFATLDMHMRFIRPALVNSGNLKLTASVSHAGKRLRVASCNIDNAEGKRVAMATLSALVVEGGVRELLRGRDPDELFAALRQE